MTINYKCWANCKDKSKPINGRIKCMQMQLIWFAAHFNSFLIHTFHFCNWTLLQHYGRLLPNSLLILWNLQSSWSNPNSLKEGFVNCILFFTFNYLFYIFKNIVNEWFHNFSIWDSDESKNNAPSWYFIIRLNVCNI